MTRAEYNEILYLKSKGMSFRDACKKLNIKMSRFNNTHYSGYPCDDEKISIKWNEKLDNELLQLMSDNHLNFSEAFRIFGKTHNAPYYTAMNRWYLQLKKTTKSSIHESVGRGLVVRNVKNAFERCPIKEEFIKESTNEMREIHNIPTFDSTITWSFKYIYK